MSFNIEVADYHVLIKI